MTALEFKNKILKSYAALLATAHGMLGKEEAEDVVQDVLRNLWEKHKSIEIKEDALHFAIKCVRNRCLDHLKKVKPEIIDINQLVSEETPSEPDDEFGYKIVMIHKAISLLTEPAKSVMKMNLNGCSTSEITDVLNLSKDNIRQILSRSRKKLRVLMLKINK